MALIDTGFVTKKSLTTLRHSMGVPIYANTNGDLCLHFGQWTYSVSFNEVIDICELTQEDIVFLKLKYF